VLSFDDNAFIDWKREINLAIMQTFEKEGNAFAYPTQIVYLERKTHE